MAGLGYGFNAQEVEDLELAYVGGLLGLDVYVDESAREEAIAQMTARPKASPDRKG